MTVICMGVLVACMFVCWYVDQHTACSSTCMSPSLNICVLFWERKNCALHESMIDMFTVHSTLKYYVQVHVHIWVHVCMCCAEKETTALSGAIFLQCMYIYGRRLNQNKYFAFFLLIVLCLLCQNSNDWLAIGRSCPAQLSWEARMTQTYCDTHWWL
jgi:hypothetical protein